MREARLILALVALLGAPVGVAHAAPMVTVHAASVGLDSIDVTVDGTMITIEATWLSPQGGFLQFEGLEFDLIYSVELIVHNESDFDWLDLSLELLDPDGQFNDASDPAPLPLFVPSGFTTSNDFDGLSFAQAQDFPRSSTVWSSVLADEGGDARDFLMFLDGTLVSGGTDEGITFGLRDLRGDGLGTVEEGVNSPFLLFISPNETEAPEPAIVGLLALAAGAALSRRRAVS